MRLDQAHFAKCGDPSDQDLVIVGMACRLPGCENVQAYWEALKQGRDCTQPADRWGTVGGTARGGLLNGIDLFDAAFFRISPSEANCMDPQHRVLLEVAHHALESCGTPIEALRKLRCGVVCTSLPGDYKFIMATDKEAAFSSQSFIGNATSSLSGRISYFYDFNGPCITLDTACSSSISALQVACLQIAGGACEAAIVGAVSIFCTDELFQFAGRTGMLSTNGRCAAFAEAADGFVPSEGAAALVLTSRKQANALGVPPLARIAAIGINHDGQSNGLMAPNGTAQTALIDDTYARAGLDAGLVGYVEAHGTGTRLGDPVEVAALTRAFRASNPKYNAYLGASKTVIGHTLVCSGLASVIKTVLVLRNGCIPPHPMDPRQDRELDLDRFEVNTTERPWPQDKTYAAVSAFGFTGSNGHLVLAAEPQGRPSITPTSHALPFLVSAQTPWSLRAKLGSYRAYVEKLSEARMGCLSLALGAGQETHRLRVAAIAATRAELLDALDTLLARPEGFLAGHLADASEGTRRIDPACEAVMRAWLEGDDTAALYPPEELARGSRLERPPYSFERKRFWVGEARRQANGGAIAQAIVGAAWTTRIAAHLENSLGFRTGEIDAARSLRDYGVDSITTIELLAALGGPASALQPQAVFDYPSITAFGTDLAAREAGAAPTNIPPAVRNAAPATPVLRWWRATGTPAGRAGRPILLLPPLNMSHDAWSRQIGELRRLGFDPEALIYPGHLDNPMGRAGWDIAAIADAVAGHITKRFNGRPQPLVGWSLGGCVALALAAQCPELVSSLVLVSTAARFDSEIFGRTIELGRELEEHADLLAILFKPGRSAAEQVGAGATMDVLGHYYDMLSRFDLTEALPRLDMPTLIVNGARDVVIDAADIARLGRMPRARLVSFPDHGHFTPLTASRRFNDALSTFLAEAA